MNAILIIGATSAIGAALAKECASKGWRLYLIGRNKERLATVAAEAEVRGAAKVETRVVDFGAVEECQQLGGWIEKRNDLCRAVILPGVLSDEFASLVDWNQNVLVNFTVPAFLGRLIGEKLGENDDGGQLVLVGSVAGDRGRQSNGFYGAQKGALEIFANALRHRCYLKNRKVKVALVKPGFVNTPMTEQIKKNALFSEPEVIAQKILRILEKGGSKSYYAPGWWFFIMSIIKAVPNFIFYRTRL